MKFIQMMMLGFLFLLPQMVTAQPFQEVNEEVRNQAVEAALKARPKAVLIYAKGLCCPSCAIGVRKMLTRLDFVDTSGENKGVDLDAKHQLVTLKIKNKGKADSQKIGVAINDAGYAPVRMYWLVKGKLFSEKIVLK